MPTLRSAVALSVIAVAATMGVRAVSARSAASRPSLPAPTISATSDTVAVLAGGCFWGVEAVFRHVKGVKSVVSGFAGGSINAPTYAVVSSGTTGHAEAVRITYDPKVVSYGTLLQVFFSVAHDPTQLNRQGPDRGTQYRSAIFYGSEEQRKVAEAYIGQLGKAHSFEAPIVTEVARLEAFHAAEEYHQDYARKNPHAPYIMINDAPKIAALEREFRSLWRDPAL